MAGERIDPQLEVNVITFNQRFEKADEPKDEFNWMREILNGQEIAFIMMHGGGHTLEVRTKNSEKEEVFSIDIHEPEEPLTKPHADFADSAEEITIMPDAQQFIVMRKLREFLIREFSEKRTMISIAVFETLTENAQGS
jgi:hypothetical protein